MNKTHRIILELLRDKGPMTGLDMIRSDARLGRGTIYVHLFRMGEAGLVASERLNDGSYRRRYRLTADGFDMVGKAHA